MFVYSNYLRTIPFLRCYDIMSFFHWRAVAVTFLNVPLLCHPACCLNVCYRCRDCWFTALLATLPRTPHYLPPRGWFGRVGSINGYGQRTTTAIRAGVNCPTAYAVWFSCWTCQRRLLPSTLAFLSTEPRFVTSPYPTAGLPTTCLRAATPRTPANAPPLCRCRTRVPVTRDMTR